MIFDRSEFTESRAEPTLTFSMQSNVDQQFPFCLCILSLLNPFQITSSTCHASTHSYLDFDYLSHPQSALSPPPRNPPLHSYQSSPLFHNSVDGANERGSQERASELYLRWELYTRGIWIWVCVRLGIGFLPFRNNTSPTTAHPYIIACV